MRVFFVGSLKLVRTSSCETISDCTSISVTLALANSAR